MNIRIATGEDLSFLFQHDPETLPDRLEKKVQGGLVYVACDEGSRRLALLKFSYFWDRIPYMDKLHVIESHRGRGIGRRIVDRWESDMFDADAELVLTSTQADEDAQHFYRKLGYRDCGVLFVPQQIPAEIFLRKLRPSTEGSSTSAASLF
ncbi:MAG: GNAT family N-acetyltransferase [bacterium]|nr:GNAT family N-acetyltransferase [bacterium]